MGILSEPKRRRKLLDMLISHGSKLSVVSYLAGILWFLAMAHPMYSAKTYFSENALLPGLVRGEYYNNNRPEKLLKEMASLYNTSTGARPLPVEWLLDKMTEIGLQSYTQSFTVQVPFAGCCEKITGTNVYGILRAPRTASTEALVLSIPYENEMPVGSNNAVGIALMLSLAAHFREHIYLAKDIIFLITEQEESGLQAWLESYHDEHSPTIQAEILHGQSGAIQAAINLELNSVKIHEFEVLVEGLNGQLPNLDLVNLVFRLCQKNGLQAVLHVEDTNMIFGEYLHALSTMTQMMFHQASGLPSANHGLFLKYRIEALTVRGIASFDARNGFQEMGRTLEGVFRSLNNLLERLHGSFFFYLLPSSSRYVSIGLYMPALGCLILGPVIQICLSWTQAGMVKPLSQKTDETKEKKKTENSVADSNAEVFFTEYPRRVGNIVPVVIATILAGCGVYYCPRVFYSDALKSLGVEPIHSAICAIFLAFLFTLLLPKILRQSRCHFSIEDIRDFSLLRCFSLILLCLNIGTLSLLNFSMAFLIAVFLVPSSLFISLTHQQSKKTLQSALLVVTFPPVFLYILCCVYSSVYMADKWQFCDVMDLTNNLYHRAILSALWGPWLIGTWAYPVVCFALLPNWLMFWVLARRT